MFASRLARKFRSTFKRPAAAAAAPEYWIRNPARDIPPLLYWADVGGPLRLHVPTSMMCMQGAFSYGSVNHPFVAALREGPEALCRFYQAFQPGNLRAMYRLDIPKCRGDDLPPWELPWLMLQKRLPPPGECGLKAEHGVSYFGPASKAKIDVEYLRLTNVLHSVQAVGYQPDKYGDIEGHFLRRGNDYRFFVRGGKHRAAALAFLRHQVVPVRLRATWPRIIDSSTANEWPLVHNGSMDVSLALAIHTKYFDSSELIPI